MNNRERIKILLERLPLLYPDARCLLEYGRDPEKLLIATILSARTTDNAVNQVTPRLWSEVQNINGLAAADRGYALRLDLSDPDPGAIWREFSPATGH